jgi:uncharacterized protein (DUF4415 family)
MAAQEVVLIPACEPRRAQTIWIWQRVEPTENACEPSKKDAISYASEDGSYDPNDAETTRAWLAQVDLIRKGKVVRRGKRGSQKAPTKKLVSLCLLLEVIDHFKAGGPGWQTRTDSMLLESIKRSA